MVNKKIKMEPVTPYNNTESKKEQVAQMFDNIAFRYDFLNSLLSLGIHKGWRKRCIRLIADKQPKHILDVATGTGDFAIAAMKLNTTMNRGSKKYFFDIFELLNHYSIKQLLSFHSVKYAFSSQMIVLKSLIYFDDAEKEPDPISTNSTSWQTVKAKIIEVVSLYNK